MPSPFPGMDPFIEASGKWLSFHSRFVTALGDALVPHVRPRYVVDVEDYVFLAEEDEQPDKLLRPDVSVAEGELDWSAASESTVGTAVVATPTILTLPKPRRIRQHYLVIRNRENQTVVTVIELLSPWNKDPSDRLKEYLQKRQNIFDTHQTHLVELDLLLSGARLPTIEPLPAGDYYALVCRKEQYPKVEVYDWTLRDKLPTIPVPLAKGDADVSLPLQEIFTETYDRAGYDYALNYRRELGHSLTVSDVQWVHETLEKPRPTG